MFRIRCLASLISQAFGLRCAGGQSCSSRRSSWICPQCSLGLSGHYWLPFLALLLAPGTALAAGQVLAPPPEALLQTNLPDPHASEGLVSQGLAGLLDGIPANQIASGILHDRVLSLAGIERFDGAPDSPAATLAEWRQVHFELYRASLQMPEWPSPEELRRIRMRAGRGLAFVPDDAARGDRFRDSRPSPIPIAILDCEYQAIRPEAMNDGSLLAQGGRLVPGPGDPLETRRAVAAAPLRDRTYRGAEASFLLDSGLYISNVDRPLPQVEADLDDGLGYREMEWGAVQTARYGGEGVKTLRIRLLYSDGSFAHASARFHVLRLDTPAPDDTLQITATIPYNGQFGSGQAYVYLAEGHESVTEPVIVLEGFDLDNSYNWDELYELLNRENFIEGLRADGFDAVVLNFTDATDYIQKHAFTAVELIQQVQAMVDPGVSLAVAGASMGGLVARYALSYMETHSLPHAVRSFISFDAPHLGADIPLGVQYWIWFFADQSEEAAAFLQALNSPAARQLLVYHFTDPPGNTGQPDPLRGAFLSDLAAAGDYPVLPRKVAASNGSGAMLDQGFSPGSQIIQWEYTSFLVDITGNVWSVPDGTSLRIFEGLIDFILLPAEEIDVVVSGTDPFDGAPGGWRASMADLDAVDPGYGDILAFHPNHCFIPTISSLALVTDDLFYDVAGDPNLLALTPFDAVYVPPLNEEHVEINALNAPWLRNEILLGASSVAPPVASGRPALFLAPPAPNPFRESTRMRFVLPRPGETQLTVHHPSGRRLALFDLGRLDPGRHEIGWDGRGPDGRSMAPGVYFLRLRAGDSEASRKVVIR